MAEKAGKAKHKRSLSLSKNRRGKADTSAAKTAPATPITTFFSQAPSKVACPLCEQLVPKSKINEHIDLQCQNFERVDNSAVSASKANVSSVVSSPKRSPAESTAQNAKKEEEGKTSPYFKKNPPKEQRQRTNKSVVRTINLGRLSSKLSRNSHQCSEISQAPNSHTFNSAETETTLNSSQKENLNQNTDNDMIISHPAMTEAPKVQTDLMRVEKDTCVQPTSSKSESVLHLSVPKLPPSSPSKAAKRKKEPAPNSQVSGSTKKAKLIRSSKNAEEVSPGENLVETGDRGEDTAWEPSTYSPAAPSHKDQVDSKTAQAAENAQRLPYYLRNFHTVLQAVLENEDDRELFNQEDMSYVSAFHKLSVMGQKLYVRLFQRKLKWLQVVKLDYGEICSDLGAVAQELVQSGFLQDDSDLQDIGEALDLLPAPELKALAKTFHLANSGTQKQQLVDGLLRLSKQKSLFALHANQNNIGTVILKRARQLAGSCVRLCRGPRAVFSRILLLFSLTDTMEEEEMAAGGQSQLFTILLVNSGRLAFPSYSVERRAKLFQDREDLIRYEAAMRGLLEVASVMQTGQWEEAMQLYTSAKDTWQELRKTHDFSHQEELPVFLRSFTVGWAYTRTLSRGVEILQRLRRYEEAVEQLQSLLLQSTYCPDSRGRWWDRLALNLHQHLKRPEQAINAIRDGLSDPLVRTGHKLSLHQRAVRMQESASCKKYRLKLRELPAVLVKDVKHVTIRGQLFPHEGGTGKSRFLLPANIDGQENDSSTLICSVEELCLAHYRQQGFDQGIHGEGSTFSTLFALLLWDIIFMEGIPDVFRNPYQACPLDLYTDCFYESRREAINGRVQLLNEASMEILHHMLEDVWTSQEGKVCSLVSWERFSSLQQAQSLLSCMGGAFLGGVIERMAKDYRHCRGGLPDLVVWNTSNNTCKLVEVKGPNDRLSQKQQIWLDELQKLGADVEVCHVDATGARGS